MWQQSVDDGHAPITPGAAPRARSARFAAAGLGLCVCAVVGVSTARRDATGSGGGAAAAAGSVAALASRAAAGAATAAGALEALAFDDDDSTIGNFSAKFNATSEREGHDSAVCKLYKRTMTSYNAYEDAEFLRNYLGLELQGNFTYHTDKDSNCAERQLMQSLDQWGVHIFESGVSEEGNVSVKEWVDDWVGAKKEFGKHFVWDAWMAQSITFYTPSLDKFLKAWEDAGVPYLARKYDNPEDGERMFTAFVYLPHAGHVMEVVSDKVGDKDKSAFSSLEDESCPSAVYVGRSVKSMKDMWKAMGGTHKNSQGLPDLLIVKLSTPSARPHALLDYVQEFGTLAIAHNETRVKTGKHECSYSTMRFRKCTFSDDDTCNDDGYDWHVDMQVVDNPSAATLKYTVEDFEQYVSSTHRENLGCNKGWDRFLDMHIGMWCQDPAKLDKIGPKMCEAGAGFHAHSAVGHLGSIWAAGAGGLGVEFHGAFDYTFFNQSDLDALDYCSKSSSGICTKNSC